MTGMHGIAESRQDACFREILNKAALVVPDGMPLLWLGQMARAFASVARDRLRSHAGGLPGDRLASASFFAAVPRSGGGSGTSIARAVRHYDRRHPYSSVLPLTEAEDIEVAQVR